MIATTGVRLSCGLSLTRRRPSSAGLGIGEMEGKGPVVDVHKLAGLDVPCIVDPACADVADVALLEEDPLSIGDQRVRFLAIELDRHLSLHDDRHLLAWAVVRRLCGPRLPALAHDLDAI